MIITHRAFCGPIRPFKLGDKIVDVVDETRGLKVLIASKLSRRELSLGTSSSSLMTELGNIHARAAQDHPQTVQGRIRRGSPR